MIDKSSPVPLYFQIASQMRESINSGKLSPRQRIPSENELAEKYNVSRVTIRQALKELEQQNYIYREQGKGSFVSPLQVKGKFGFGGFTEKALKMGYKPSSRVLDFHIVDSLPAELVNILSPMERGDSKGPFAMLKRVRYLDGDPVALEQVYLPVHLYPGIENLRLTESDSLYETLKERWGAQPLLSETVLTPDSATEEQARCLEIASGDPLLVRWQRVWSQTQIVLEFTHSYYTKKYAVQLRWQSFD